MPGPCRYRSVAVVAGTLFSVNARRGAASAAARLADLNSVVAWLTVTKDAEAGEAV